MANISDATDIIYQSENTEVIDVLFKILKTIDGQKLYYNMLYNPQKQGNHDIVGDVAMGRWCYSSNIERFFENPESWIGEEIYKLIVKDYERLLELLNDGAILSVSYSDVEEGCGVDQEVQVNIYWDDLVEQVGIDFTITDNESTEV